MRNDDLEARMRSLEWFHSLRALPGTWPIVRVDGRSFTRLANEHFERPFDVRFHDAMVKTAEALLVELQGLFAFTESDEISVLLPADSQLFDREVEKLVSLSAGIASAEFTQSSGLCAHFDSRLWLGPTLEQVRDYFRWRQSDAARCCLNGWCYRTLRQEGFDAPAASRALSGKNFSDKNELLFARGINFNDLPAWQKHGVGLYWHLQEKTGFNPVTGQTVTAQRRQIQVDKFLPRGEAFADMVAQLAASATSSRPAIERETADGSRTELE